jgi:hypothetical protein
VRADLAVTHVTVIDTENGRSRPDVTAVITGEHFVAVGDGARVHPPRGAQVTDGLGKFLIP